ncbi:ABC transporter permease subunit [Rossellomorea vietnamensis]|uniref:ABC transporter permease subunit n=1 Tax=Rossellomorea vietnamensis TaxID=218284 RepID=UPI00308C253D|nr:ABC transporter permease subunit [Rossellomorea vietnamensis]
MNIARVVPSILLSFLLLLSVIWPIMTEEPVAKPFLYDEKGEIMDTTPYPPSSLYWLGTDREGKDLFYELMTGAKWTMLVAFIVALLRITLSTLLGVWLHKWLASLYVEGLLHALTFVPQSLIAIIWLTPFLLYEVRSAPPLSMAEAVLLQVLVLVTVGVPTTARMIGETVRHIHSFEFMDSVKVLGGSSFHLARKHVFPHLLPRLFILSGRQLVQVLTLMLHLSIFHLFIGGTIITSGQEHDQFNVHASSTYEWAGLIGSRYGELLLEPYIVVFPVMAYSLLILLMNMMIKNLEKSYRKV